MKDSQFAILIASLIGIMAGQQTHLYGQIVLAGCALYVLYIGHKATA